MTEFIHVSVNGDPRAVPAGSTIADLLAALGLPAGKVAVERNLAIAPKSSHASKTLEDGDRLEIVHFVGGG